MAIFDQRHQNVNSQINVSFSNVKDLSDFVKKLEMLQNEVNDASTKGIIDKEIAIDVESQLKKAVINAEKSEPDKNYILQYLNGAKDIVSGVSAAKGLVDSIVNAIESIGALF